MGKIHSLETFSDGAFYEGKGKGHSHLSGYIRDYVSKETYRNRTDQ